jgi:hypothetical protein
LARATTCKAVKGRGPKRREARRARCVQRARHRICCGLTRQPAAAAFFPRSRPHPGGRCQGRTLRGRPGKGAGVWEPRRAPRGRALWRTACCSTSPYRRWSREQQRRRRFYGVTCCIGVLAKAAVVCLLLREPRWALLPAGRLPPCAAPDECQDLHRGTPCFRGRAPRRGTALGLSLSASAPPLPVAGGCAARRRGGRSAFVARPPASHQTDRKVCASGVHKTSRCQGATQLGVPEICCGSRGRQGCRIMRKMIGRTPVKRIMPRSGGPVSRARLGVHSSRCNCLLLQWGIIWRLLHVLGAS